MNNILTSVYGRGWAFPPEFTLEDGVIMAEGEVDVQQSLRILFSTMPGERIMRPDYGCDLQAYMFQNVREELLAQIATTINDGIRKYEPRAVVDSCIVTVDETKFNHLLIQVSYRLRGSDIAQEVQGILNIGDGQGVRFI